MNANPCRLSPPPSDHGANDTTRVEDAKLLERWQSGEQLAGTTLVKRYAGGLWRFFASKVGEQQAMDLVQGTLLRCSERVLDIGPGNFRAYMFAVARSQLVDHFRASGRIASIDDLSSRSLQDLVTSPSGRIAKREQAQILTEALTQLPIDQQIALELAYWEGLNAPEIAQVLQIPANTVRGRLSRARESLRIELARLA